MNNLYSYSYQHKYNRFILAAMLGFAKYRLNHLHGIQVSFKEACKINQLLNGLYVGEIGDLQQTLINTRTDPTAFNELYSKAKAKHLALDYILQDQLVEWRLYLTLDLIRKHLNKNGHYDKDAFLEIGENVSNQIFNLAEHFILILLNEDEVYADISAFKPHELYKYASEINDWYSDKGNIKLVYDNFGEQFVSTLFAINSHIQEMRLKAIEANYMPNDYDSN
jgi:hypothetical protein